MKKPFEKYGNQLGSIGRELFPVLVGLSFGYNLALIAGDTILNTSNTPDVVLSKSLLYGALTGCIFVFSSWDYRTRQAILTIGIAISLIVSFFGAIVFWMNDFSKDLLYPIRFIMGITAGMSCVAPVYLVEESPKSTRRGIYFASYQLAITIGILLAYIIMNIYDVTNFNNDNNKYYSIVFIVCSMLSAVSLFTIWQMNSPKYSRWYEKHEKFKTKKDGLIKYLEIKYDEIKNMPKGKEKDRIYQEYIRRKDYINELLEEPNCIRKEPWYKVYKIPLILSIVIIGIQQVVGINVVIFKLPELLSLFGITKSGVLFFLLVIGLINVLSTIPGMLMIDKVERRTLFLIGMIGMVCSLLLMTLFISYIKPNFKMIPEKYYIQEDYCIKEQCLLDNDQILMNNCDKQLFVIDSTALSQYFLNSQRNIKFHDRDCFRKEHLLEHSDVCVITKKDSGLERDLKKYDDKNLNNANKKKGDIISYKLHFKNGIINTINGKEIHSKFEPLFGHNHYVGLVIFMSLVTLYIIFFASTLGILGWLVPAEILPIKIRSQGMAIVAFVHWSINLMIVSFFRIDLVSSFFITFSILSLIALAIGFFYFPETNRKELKDIDFYWRNKGNLEDFNDQNMFNKKSKDAEIKSNKYMKDIEDEFNNLNQEEDLNRV